MPRVDGTGDGEEHGRHPLHDRVGKARRPILLLVRISDAEQEIVAECEAEVPRDIVQVRVHIEHVRVVANHHQRPSPLDVVDDGGNFIRRITRRRRLDDQHVTIGQCSVVNRLRFQQSRHLVSLAAVLVNRGVVVGSGFAVDTRSIRLGGRFPAAVPFHDTNATVLAMSDRLKEVQRHQNGDSCGHHRQRPDEPRRGPWTPRWLARARGREAVCAG